MQILDSLVIIWCKYTFFFMQIHDFLVQIPDSVVQIPNFWFKYLIFCAVLLDLPIKELVLVLAEPELRIVAGELRWVARVSTEYQG